jgi:hypothetical protein
MDDALRQAKLAKLVEIEGYDSSDELLEAVFSDAVSPAICAEREAKIDRQKRLDELEGDPAAASIPIDRLNASNDD